MVTLLTCVRTVWYSINSWWVHFNCCRSILIYNITAAICARIAVCWMLLSNLKLNFSNVSGMGGGIPYSAKFS